MRIHHRSRQSRTGSLPHFSNQPRDSRAGDARSGAALILALAILLVLLSLAITFFLIVRFETNIARQAYDRAQAAHLLDAALATTANLIASLASNPAYLNRRPDEIGQVLAADLRNVPFFTQLILLDPSGNTVGGYPAAITRTIRRQSRSKWASRMP